ncbi:DUF3800 domain-containing protein [Rhizobium laguerreae]|uniref:DUF3800 domain-containing protein n=1 Tax=Rhizobium laguerreae TaxID=1076926 RepID=UPI001C928897|nr:DUF3800 domain-containing protein [Rhizobium laguerreae]MBY3154466.1 DUF3800 domain-containing protein [Rhizobium laguerreae]
MSVVLQAFIDDSASDKGDRRLFMAGYLNRADKWHLFSEAWNEELRMAPSISYLRMAEANNLRGEFKGWAKEAREQKLHGLARVINHFEPMSFQFTINREEYSRVLTPVSPRGLGTPHFTCCFSVVSGVSRYVASAKVRVPIEFIFDEQEGVSADMALLFHEMKRSIPRGARKLISAAPVFGNDKLVPPLQAADMLAWHLRREHESRKSEIETLPTADLLRNPHGHLVSHTDDTYIRKWAEHHEKQEGIDFLKSKRQWQKFRQELSGFADAGLIPPNGSRLAHFLFNCE